MQNKFSISGRIVDIEKRQIATGIVHVSDGKISSIEYSDLKNEQELPYIMPGFIDSHVHIESSMLIPSEFARMAVVHGTVGTVSDPHEIANVCGIEGVEYMIANGATVPFKFNFGAPSCVPATNFETAGAAITAEQVEMLLQKPAIRYLSEMMNFPGVLNGDAEVITKIAAAKKAGKPVDGHAPGLRNEQAAAYIAAGISTDHECFTSEEALDKLNKGMKILIREGSAAKNFEALIPLLAEHPNEMMFCSDDKHPDSLAEGHINELAARAVAYGIDLFNVLQAACVNPVKHYQLDIGLLKTGDPADFILVDDLVSFKASATFIDGIQVAANGSTLIGRDKQHIADRINNFNCDPVKAGDFAITDTEENYKIFSDNIIVALDGQLITEKVSGMLKRQNGSIDPNPGEDYLKIVVVNRYSPAKPAVAFINKFGISGGALASSVAHDSHNIVAVGDSDEAIAKAVNLVITAGGGISCVSGEREMIIGLPVAGLMTDNDGYEVAAAYTDIDLMAKSLGSKLRSPFMTLSFMALLVIPQIKLSDLGLFDGDQFSIITRQPVS
jgi:adenine deaminase